MKNYRMVLSIFDVLDQNPLARMLKISYSKLLSFQLLIILLSMGDPFAYLRIWFNFNFVSSMFVKPPRPQR